MLWWKKKKKRKTYASITYVSLTPIAAHNFKLLNWPNAFISNVSNAISHEHHCSRAKCTIFMVLFSWRVHIVAHKSIICAPIWKSNHFIAYRAYHKSIWFAPIISVSQSPSAQKHFGNRKTSEVLCLVKWPRLVDSMQKLEIFSF